MTALLGIDIGTTNVKAAIIDAESARVLSSAGREVPMLTPGPGMAEQHPDDWWDALVNTMWMVLADAGVPPDGIAAIGISGQMHGVVLVDGQNRPVRPAITWADARTGSQLAALLSRGGYEPYAPGPPAAGFMALTLMWLARYQPKAIRGAETALCPKDYVRLLLTGQRATDPSDAAATWLFDVRRGRWSPELLGLCGLDERLMPSVYGSSEIAGQLTAEAAEALGLVPGIPVVTGAADLAAQAVGYGLIEPGTALVTVGTGGQVFHALRSPVENSMTFYTFNHAVPGRWYAQAAILAAGLSMRWLRNTLGLEDREDAYEYLDGLAAEVPPGAGGLLFLPYLAGNRTPHMDPHAGGAFVGLGLHHTPGHLARAVMEGVAFALRDCIDVISAGDPDHVPDRVILSGGAGTSALWRSILADVFNTELLQTTGSVQAPLGAALLAGGGARVYPHIRDAVARLPGAESAVQPSSNVGQYAEWYAAYRGVYPALRDTLHDLARRSGR